MLIYLAYRLIRVIYNHPRSLQKYLRIFTGFPFKAIIYLFYPRPKMREEFFRYLFTEIVQTALEEQKDVEIELKKLGHDIGKRMIMLSNFRRELNIDALMYRIVFILLPELYDTPRSLERGRENDSFLIVENTPLFNKYISLPVEYEGFSCDSIVGGVIESVLKASGFNPEVTVHNSKTDEFPDRVIYVVKYDVYDREVIEL